MVFTITGNINESVSTTFTDSPVFTTTAEYLNGSDASSYSPTNSTATTTFLSSTTATDISRSIPRGNTISLTLLNTNVEYTHSVIGIVIVLATYVVLVVTIVVIYIRKSRYMHSYELVDGHRHKMNMRRV